MSNGTAPFQKKPMQAASSAKNPKADWAKEFNMAFSQTQNNGSKNGPPHLPTPAPRPTEGLSLPTPPTVANPNFGSKPALPPVHSMTYPSTPRTQGNGNALSTSLSVIAALSSLFAALCLAYSYFTTIP